MALVKCCICRKHPLVISFILALVFFLFYSAPHPTGVGRQNRLLLLADQRHHGEEKLWFDAKKEDGIEGSIKGEDIFNSSKHEVPSGPNPVSNR
jgi:hypothetical protein